MLILHDPQFSYLRRCAGLNACIKFCRMCLVLRRIEERVLSGPDPDSIGGVSDQLMGTKSKVNRENRPKSRPVELYGRQ